MQSVIQQTFRLTYCVLGPKRGSYTRLQGRSEKGMVVRWWGRQLQEVEPGTLHPGGLGKLSAGNDVPVSPEGKWVEGKAGTGAEGCHESSRLGHLGQRE